MQQVAEKSKPIICPKGPAVVQGSTLFRVLFVSVFKSMRHSRVYM